MSSRKNFWKMDKWAWGALIIIIILVSWMSYDISKKSDKEPSLDNISAVNAPVVQQQVIKVTAKQLFKDYSDNEVAADEIYKGKQIELTGIIEGVNKDILDDVYILINAGDFDHIHCSMQDKKGVMNIKKGQKVTVMGTGGSMILVSPTLDNCIIIQ